MAAKLEWKAGSLCLGRIEVATTEWRAADGYRYRISGWAWSGPHQEEADCRHGCESEVRRLLKEAGVEVE